MKTRSSFGWVDLILGILLIVLGIYTLANPATALVSLVIVYGIIAIITGIVDIVIYVKLERRIGIAPTIALVTGILGIIAGILLLFNVGAGSWILSLVFAIWFIVHCISRLANLGVTRRVAGKGAYWVTLILNVIGIILGVFMVINPVTAALTMVYLVSFYLILAGISSIVMAFGQLGG